jgi:lipopolysaccharide/colanic/teichoic acid biosynthesis glycosyltransferase
MMTIVSHLAEAAKVQQMSRSRRLVPEWVEDAANRLAGALLLLALSPLLALVALAVWRVDGAPILYGHYRVGHRGRIFKCLKFRTMRRDSEEVLAELLETDPAARREWEREQKLARDPRVTGIGHLLRQTSLDELPQLINVVRGEMSLVGPRPITVQELSRYGYVRWHYLAVRPGMTGLWQVSGRNRTTYEERVNLDRNYVEQRSLWLDLRILARTIKVVVARDGAV